MQTLWFVVIAMVAFRLLYGAFPSTEGSFLPWLLADSRAQWSFGGSILIALICTALTRRRSVPEADERIRQAKAFARQGLAHHEARQFNEAVQAFTRAKELYAGASRDVEAAPIYGSLGKLYFDFDQLDLAEACCNEALTRFEKWPNAREEVRFTSLLLETIGSRRRVSPAIVWHEDPQYHFTLTIPANWGTQVLEREFVRSGGRGAWSHQSHAATFNIAVGPLREPELHLPEVRVVSVRRHLLKEPGRVGDITADTPESIGGEANVVTADWDIAVMVGPQQRHRHCGFASVVHNGLEYVMRWSAEAEYEPETRGIMVSFVPPTFA